MLYRKIERPILEFMTGKRDKVVLSNSAAIRCENSIDYIPVYYSMFI